MSATPHRQHERRALLADAALAALCIGGLSIVLPRAYAPLPARAETGRTPAGCVVSLHNDVRRRGLNALVWEGLRAGVAVYPEDAIYASSDSQAELTFSDGTRLLLDENSLVRLRAPASGRGAPDSPLDVDLIRGAARASAGSRGLAITSGSSRVFVSAAADARVREGSHGALVSVSTGSAELAVAGRPALRVGAGQLADVERGVRPVEIGLEAPAEHARLTPPDPAHPVVFRWHSSRAERGCAVELATDPGFSTAVPHPALAMGRLELGTLAPGLYHWRVGCAGGDAEARSEERTLEVAAATPPAHISPGEGELVDLSRGGHLVLSWSELPDAAGYQVELARDGRFDAQALAADPRLPTYRVAGALQEGRYCYRMRAGAEGAPWSSPTCFRVITRPVLTAPHVYEPRREELPPASQQHGSLLLELLLPSAHAAMPRSALVLRWDPIPGAAAYVLEIAEDPLFHALVLRRKGTDTFFRWPIVARRDYYWRVRAVDDAGREGAASEVVKIGSEVSAPSGLSPAEGAQVVVAPGAPVWLRWTPSQVLQRYRIELASDEHFTRDRVTLESAEAAVSWAAPRLGRVFWRVTGIDLNGQSTSPSIAQAFSVLPSAPDPVAPSDGWTTEAWHAPQEVQLAWAARPVGGYEVELSRGGFALKLSSAKPSVTARLERPGLWRWRVRGTSPETPWSPRRRFEITLATPELLPADPTAGETVQLSWTPVPLANGYELTVQGPEAATPEVFSFTAPTARMAALRPGSYQVSVRAIAGSSGERVTSAASAPRAVGALAPTPAAAGAADSSASSGAAEAGLIGERGTLGRQWWFGVRAGLVTNLGAIAAPQLGVEARWIPARWRGRLAISLNGGYYGAGQQFGEEALSTRSHLSVVPIDASLLWAVPFAGATWALGAGPLARVVYGSVQVSGVPEQSATRLELGGIGRLGAERRLGPGTASLQLGLALATRSVGLFTTSPASVSLLVGYGVAL